MTQSPKHIANIRGKVRKGKQRGASLGFPTANIKLHKNIEEGIYISQATHNKQSLPALTFIGNAKTFGETEILAETHFLTISDDLYGRWISIHLIKKIRENRKFASTSQLIKQMQKDRKIARLHFNL